MSQRIDYLNNDAASYNLLVRFDSGRNSVMIDRLDYLRNEIFSFTQYPNNWDGYGAVPLFSEIAEKACEFLPILNGGILDLITDIYPNPHGTLVVDWEHQSGKKLSLEIGVNNYSYFAETDGNTIYVNGEDMPGFQEFISHLDETFNHELPRLSI